MLTAFVENNGLEREVIVNKTKMQNFAYAIKHKRGLFVIF